MNSNRYRQILGMVLLLLATRGFSQVPSFYHLNIENGLYDNHVRSLAINRHGFLWIGTEEGLNLYDGHSFTVYHKDKYPGMPSNNITHLFCDSRNRLWVGTSEGVAFFNNKNQFNRVILNDSTRKFITWSIFQTETRGMVLINNLGHFFLDEKTSRWKKLETASLLLEYKDIRAVRWYNADKTLFATDSSIILFDYGINAVVKEFKAKNVKSICKLRGSEFAYINSEGEVLVVDGNSGKITRDYQLDKPDPTEIKQAANGDLIIATGLNGLTIIDTKGNISHHVHSPLIPTSLIGNNAYRIATGSNGEVVIGTSTSGISIYNTNLNQAGFNGFFRDETGNFYDNYTGGMAEDGDLIWIGAYDRLIKWNKKKNSVVFYYDQPKTAGQKRPHNINALCKDRSGIIWVGLEGKGVAWFSPQTGKFTQLAHDTALSPVFKSKTILALIEDEDGLIWAATTRGIFTINPITKRAVIPAADEMNRELRGKIVQDIFIDSKKRKWFATINNGLYCFDKAGNKLSQYSKKDGLPSDACYMIREDKKGRFFVVTAKGFSMMDDKAVLRTLTPENGLRYERCESVLIDDNDMVWFSNRKCLVKYDADKNEPFFYDENAGLLNNGFRVRSCIKTKTGEMFWGGYRGVSFFNPAVLKINDLPLQVSVYGLLLKDSVMDLSQASAFKTTFANNTVTFRFAAIHLGIPGKTFYQYRLNGFDKDWQREEDISQARYSALPAGQYNFEVKASIDGLNWVEAREKISVTVVPVFWRTWWFFLLSALFVIAALWWIIQNRNKKIRKQQEDLETEKAINYFANSLHEHQTVETILWDVARNCIGRLYMEDCVIYLVDEKKKALVQKAAYGPKSSASFSITEPLEIPLGHGITGAVAVSGKAEIVKDTSVDDRYILDDEKRLSEIAVPIISGNKVIGVIDCEHHKKNYFTTRHLSILNTIASLCANKIVRAGAEEEKRKAEAILSNTEKRMAEVEMQALRAQMNPHFIFNCLNSINRYIVKSDQATASLYLTRFAKLIRLILDNSGNKTVSLSSELEALKLYIEMEALRFDKKFSYEIVLDRHVNPDSIDLPPLMLQPYVENAIWHGLLHKDTPGHLNIKVRLADESMLECIIEDNGVGRSKSAELKSKTATSRKSLGMQLTENRLALLNRHAELNASIQIIDLTNDKNEPAGTKVLLLIPV